MTKGDMGWGPFTLPASHPFNLGAALLHDAVYQAYLNGNADTQDLITADKAYFKYMKAIAKEHKSKSLLLQAYLFNAIIKVFRLTARMPGKAPMPPE